MYLYFEDWSYPWIIAQLDEKGLEHGGKVIKVYTSDRDPREVFGLASLKTVEVSSDSLRGMQFHYEGRNKGEAFSGDDIEGRIEIYPEHIRRRIRALFRFANDDSTRFCHEGMSIKLANGEWLIKHPIEDVDGLENGLSIKRPVSIHLDIFNKNSLKRLNEIVDYSNNSYLVPTREGTIMKRKLNRELRFGNFQSKETE